MLNIEDSQKLIEEFISLRDKRHLSKEDDRAFQKHERLCIEKFKYLITMKTSKYKLFSNYDDLNQDGLEALLKAMKNYNPQKGIFFWWAHKYIDTKISRSANLHTAIRYPLKIAKARSPHKETNMPIIIEQVNCPDKQLEKEQVSGSIQSALAGLSDDQKNIINLAYGFTGDKPISINKICQKLNISRFNCIKEMNSSLSLLKNNIRL